jgi:hypothetical protein
MISNNRHAEITATDHGPLVNIASWTLMCMSVLFTAFRLISSIVLRGTAGKDDVIIVVATAFAIAQSIATSFMVANGLGQHQSTLRPASIERFQQASLASSVLYVVALAASRMSILMFLGRLISVAQKRFRIMMKATLVIILLHLVGFEYAVRCHSDWIFAQVVEVLCLSFACNLPATWDYINGRCLDLVAFWDFDTAFDIATSLAVMAVPIVIVTPLQMSTGRKLKAILAFIFQLPPCVFAAIRLLYLHRAFGSRDHTWDSVDLHIWTQINLHFSIVAANMPSLNIFLDGTLMAMLALSALMLTW